jgi:formylmethanofuran dehydrogenase subunit A
MRVKLKGGRVIDPVNKIDGVRDLHVEDGRIVAPFDGEGDVTHDLAGKIVMAGAIDPHSHIAGGNVNQARILMPELQALAAGPGFAKGPADWSAYRTGCEYARMGYTTVIEPAVAPHSAINSHLELMDIPILDVGALTILGNDDYSLELLRGGASEDELIDWVAWTLDRSKGLGLKVINAGGAAAFKFNARTFGLDDEVPAYGVSSRRIMRAMQKAAGDLGVPHPAHTHINNLGVAGNIDTAVASMEAAEGQPIHFAHIQFYCYGKGGERGLSSEAPRLIEALKKHPNVTVDVGQVLFGQTVTISGDVLRQFDGRRAASPKKWLIQDGDGNGIGIVPYKYNVKSFVNAVQWAIGLELFLLADDLWRVLFTTDHPNGALFTRYPEIIRLLMSADERAKWIEKIPEAAREVIHLPGISRELDLNEIAILTRGAPAKLMGFTDRGHLGQGAVADIAVYAEQEDKRAMFARADLVLKNGEVVVKKGEVVKTPPGRCIRVTPEMDRAVSRRVEKFYGRYYDLDPARFSVPDTLYGREDRFEALPCLR